MKTLPPNPYLKRRPFPRPDFLLPRAARLKQDPAVMIIQGVVADSKEEWYVAQALDKLGLEYEYQKSVRGGRLVRGGQVLDFLVYTPGRNTVVDVRGKYWHTGKHEDELSLKIALKGKDWNVVVIWDYEATSVEAALSILRERMPQA